LVDLPTSIDFTSSALTSTGEPSTVTVHPSADFFTSPSSVVPSFMWTTSADKGIGKTQSAT
jgi:hypothetical protein